jgi:hypothetical protein
MSAVNVALACALVAAATAALAWLWWRQTRDARTVAARADASVGALYENQRRVADAVNALHDAAAADGGRLDRLDRHYQQDVAPALSTLQGDLLQLRDWAAGATHAYVRDEADARLRVVDAAELRIGGVTLRPSGGGGLEACGAGGCRALA